ncbi:zinc-binding dehydrogenase [Peribacillus sp. NPDC058002]|uniref:zinc-dependent alcohol dehydrogenase n=1 Tax=Peribacillus sp. NPDC058002 TaxID=3346301 RepID=UPI0036DD126E
MGDESVNKMKAAVVVAPHSIKMTEVPIPTPAENEVLVQVKYAGICGTDLKIYDGSIPYIKEGLLSFPTIPGHEWSGEVVGVGERVSKVKIGDRITGECHIGCGVCNFCLDGRNNLCPDRIRVGIIRKAGAFAEYLTIPERGAHLLPSSMSYQEGALVEPLTVALYSLGKIENITGASVLIFGLGPIGLLVCQLARSMGATTIIGVDTNPDRLREGIIGGCDDVTSLTGQDLRNYVFDKTEGKGVNVVIEAAGIPKLLALSIELASLGGQISLLGLYHQNAEVATSQIIAKELRIYGNMASARVWERAINLIATKRIKLDSITNHILPFKKIQEAMNLAYNKESKVTKITIEF